MIYFNSIIPFPLSHITILINLSPKLRAPKRPVWYKNPSGTTIPTDGLVSKGSVHKVRYAIFGQFLPPSPCHTLSHIPGSPESTSHILDPLPRFLVGLVKISRTKAPCTNSLSIVREGFCPGVLSEGLLSGRFSPGWFLSIPPSVRIHLLQQKVNITLNFMFHMYDKKMYKCDVTCSLPPFPCHKLSHLLGPPPLERDVLYGRPQRAT